MKLREKSPLTKCNECTLNQLPYVPPQLPDYPQFPVLFIGRAPGRTEGVTGVPFTGKAGKMSWRLLKEAGLNKDKLPITNIVGCPPPGDRKPTELEIACCWGRLQNEIFRVQPELIIAFGDTASKALVGKSAILSIRGQTFPLLRIWEYECPVLCILHPSFVMRQRQWIDLTIGDLKQITKFFTEGVSNIEVGEEQPNFIYDPSPHQLAEIFNIMEKTKTAFDTETPGELNPRKAKIIGASFCASPNMAVAFDLYPGDSRWEVMEQFLEDIEAEKIAQNGQFDIAVAETNKIKVEGLVFDTRLAEHILASDMPLNLDFLRSKYTKIKPYKPPKKEMKNIHHWDKQKRLEYGCWDALTTYQVAMEQMELMDSRSWKVLNEIDLPLIPVINKMERKGVLVDQPTLALMYKQLLPQLEEIEKQCFTPLNLNPNSPVQLKKYFDIEDTEEDTLVKYIKRGHEHSELMQHTLDYRDLQKTTSVYLYGVYNRLEEGRIHTRYDIAGTGTGGRLSSSNPNLQNVPRPLRVIYITDEGKMFVEGDYEQLELRVLAIISQEPTMLKELAEGKNTHHIIGYEIFKKLWDKLTEQQKLRAKAVVFGTAYGRGARSIAMEFNIPTSVADSWQSLCVNRYPGFDIYKQRQQEEFTSTGQCSTVFGRVRTLQTLTQAFNTPVQSPAGDITKIALINLDKAGLDLRLTTHDDVVTQFDEGEVKEGVVTMREIMERPIEEMNSYRFPVKMGVGKNWYELEEV